MCTALSQAWRMVDCIHCLRNQSIMSTDTTPETTSTPETPAPAAPSSARKGGSKRGALLGGGLVLLLILLGGAYLYREGKLPIAGLGAATDSRAGEVVARVDGAEIMRGELDKRVAQAIKAQPQMEGQPVDAALEQQVLDELINMQLILNVAKSSNVNISDEQVDTELSNLVTQMGGEETFEQQLSLVGMTRDELRVSMRNDLTARAVINANTDVENVTVSDDDVRNMYDEQVAGQEGAPEFEQVSEMIRDQLSQQQSGVIVSAYLEELRGKASIEVLI